MPGFKLASAPWVGSADRDDEMDLASSLLGLQPAQIGAESMPEPGRERVELLQAAVQAERALAAQLRKKLVRGRAYADAKAAVRLDTWSRR